MSVCQCRFWKSFVWPQAASWWEPSGVSPPVAGFPEWTLLFPIKQWKTPDPWPVQWLPQLWDRLSRGCWKVAQILTEPVLSDEFPPPHPRGKVSALFEAEGTKVEQRKLAAAAAKPLPKRDHAFVGTPLVVWLPWSTGGFSLHCFPCFPGKLSQLRITGQAGQCCWAYAPTTYLPSYCRHPSDCSCGREKHPYSHLSLASSPLSCSLCPVHHK